MISNFEKASVRGKGIFGRIKKQIMSRVEKMILRRYNPFTVENFFRKKGCRIGSNNRIYIKGMGSEPYLVEIGNHCTITTGVAFITHDGGAWVFREEIPELNVFGKIVIRDNCFIGINAVIMPNVTIGPNSVVGAGSVVTKDVPPDTVVVGSPARVICTISEYKDRCIKKWESLGLQGPRETWEKQLKKYFWSE